MADGQNGKGNVTTRFYLNALRHDGIEKLVPPPRGMWESSDGFLANYSDSVDAGVQINRTDMTHSVPSVFQRPMQFYWALGSREHPLHDVITGEWRGLLAAIALNQWMTLGISQVEFAVPTLAGEKEGATKEWSSVGDQTKGDLHFRTILRHQLPMRLVPGDPARNISTRRESDWEKWWIIRCGNARAAIGATSPWTLVYTSASYKPPIAIPWQENGLLIDPIEHYDPGRKRSDKPLVLSLLYFWVRWILAQQEHWGIPRYLGVQEKVVITALKDWLSTLGQYERPDISQRTVKIAGSMFPMAPLSNILLEVDRASEQDSDYFLTGDPRLLVLSENLTPERRIVGGIFAGRVDLHNLPPSGNSFTTIDGETVSHPYIIAEKVLFPPTLVELSLSDQALRAGLENVSLPLTPAYVQYFGFPDTQRISVTRSGKALTARLQLPLANGILLPVEKTWKLSDVQDESQVKKVEKGTPAFALWPDKYDPNWTNNDFAAYSAPDFGNLRVRPLYVDGTPTPDEMTACNKSDQKQTRIWALPRPAIGFALRLGATEKTAVDAGLVLRKDLGLPPTPNPHIKWHVAVDFGTSSTTVMYKVEGEHETKEMRFGGRTLFLTQSDVGRSDNFDNVSYNLYPSEAKTPPFLTLLYRSAATVFGDQVNPYTLRFTSSAETLASGEPVPDVKWTGQLVEYLQALVRYIVWEARLASVSKLEFHWSYPLSLTPGAHQRMSEFWQGVGAAFRASGMTIHATEDGMSESEAICRALCTVPNTRPVVTIRTGSLVIAVDVGGGSTDVAFWSDSTLLDQFSFKLAGNDILNEQYLTNEALKELFTACYGKVSEAAQETVMAHRRLYLNAAMTEAVSEGKVFRGSDPHQHPIPNYFLGRAESRFPWQQFRSMIYLFFTGVCYYLGICARGQWVEQSQIQIYFGGRGSAFLTWLTRSGQRTSGVLECAFRTGLDSTFVPYANERLSGKRDVKFLGLPFADDERYPQLKSEVATGLLRSDQTDNLVVNLSRSERLKGANTSEEALMWKARTSDATSIAGERFWKMKPDAHLIDWYTVLKPEDWAKLLPPSPSEFESTAIGHFRSAILKASTPPLQDMVKMLSLDTDLLNQLDLDGNSIHNEVLGAGKKKGEGPSATTSAIANEDRITQPIFAYELDYLMDQYARLAGTAAKIADPNH